MALELHPDVAGSEGSEKFQSVNNAYAALRNLSDNELAALSPKLNDFKSNLRQISKIDGILEKYEAQLRNLSRKSQSQAQIPEKFLNAVIFRLKSANPKIINIAINLAVKNSPQITNNLAFKRSLTKILSQKNLDLQTAILASQLKFTNESRRKLALEIITNAQNFPLSLIFSLISDDQDLLEKYLLQVKPEYVAQLIRRVKTPSQSLLKNLLSSDLPEILVPTLSMLKQHFPNLATQHKSRLAELSEHEAPTVRAWARSL